MLITGEETQVLISYKKEKSLINNDDGKYLTTNGKKKYSSVTTKEIACHWWKNFHLHIEEFSAKTEMSFQWVGCQ